MTERQSLTLERNQANQMTRKIRILFVCTGNICRSPMAEAVFVHLVKEAGLENHFEIDSAGTGNWHIDSAAHPGTLGILEENGIEYCGVGRQISPHDLHDFDFVITMDDEHLSHVLRMEKRRAKAARKWFRCWNLHPISACAKFPIRISSAASMSCFSW